VCRVLRIAFTCGGVGLAGLAFTCGGVMRGIMHAVTMCVCFA